MKKYLLLILAFVITLSFCGCNTPENMIGTRFGVVYFNESESISEIICSYHSEPSVKEIKIEDEAFVDSLRDAIDGKIAGDDFCDCEGDYQIKIDNKYYFNLHTDSIVVYTYSDKRISFTVDCSEAEMKELYDIIELEIGEEQNDKQPESAPLLKSRGAKSVSVTSLPEGYDYYYEGNDAKLIEDYLFDLNLISDFEENPDEYFGMTWVISLEYENGEERTVYHFGNMFIRAENEPWYRMTYEEAYRFDALLIELNGKDDSAVECKYLTEKDGVYTLTLPQSGEEIELRNERADFVPYITSDLVEAAERKITEDVSDYSRHSDFYLQITDGYLCLVSEVIKNIDPPVTSDGYEIGGCGYDHEHLFFSERISDRALSYDKELTTEEIKEIALRICQAKHDYVEAYYDVGKKEWIVGFWENGATFALQTVFLDADGNVLQIRFAD